MGRSSLAKIFFDSLEGPDSNECLWVVLYDFHGSPPNPNFWSNVGRVSSLDGGGGLTQFSVYMTRSRKGAAVVAMLARHYGAEVLLLKGEEVCLDELTSMAVPR